MDTQSLMPLIAVLVAVQLVLQAFSILDLITSRSHWAYRLLWISIVVVLGLIGAVAYLTLERRHVVTRLQSWRVGH